MERKIIHITEDLFEWAKEYVIRKRIKGPQGNISLSEFIRQLLKDKKKEDDKKTKGVDRDEV